jgi:DnaJ-class molecular chaperone with C-terminal Zn finger domain
MAIAFGEIDPYEVLGVDKDATPIEIKKSYKKLCLKYHPDKIQQQQQTVDDAEKFPKVQFAYSILSDPQRRQRYDETGSLDESEVDDCFNWKEYFDSINTKISIEMIDEDRAKYQNSQEERDDILSIFVYYEGDFLKLFELIPHLEFTESEENRVFKIVEESMFQPEFSLSLEKHAINFWNKYKRLRKTKVKQMLKKLAKEAREAHELETLIADKGKRNLKSENDLALLIKSRQSNRMDSLINSLESKYVKKPNKRPSKDLNDEFDRIQQNLMKNKRSKN